MANRATITYNGRTISTEDRDGSFNVTYNGSTIATIGAGQTKTLNCANQVMKTNVVVGGKTLNCAKYKMATNIVVSVVNLFPTEPSSYNLIGTYTSSQTWTAPEDGYFQIEVFGASGNGGNGAFMKYSTFLYYTYGGGGGGGGGYACSRIKMNKGDTIALTVGGVGVTSSASINSSFETYSALSVTNGANGGNATTSPTMATGSGGEGGKATGGNYANKNGGNGGTGKKASKAPASGGAGGTVGYTGGNAGGAGGGAGKDVSESGGAGAAGFIKIYRGNTNLDNNTSEPYTRLNYIESTGTQYIDTGVAPTTSMKVMINLTPISSGMSEHAIFGSTWAANGFFLMFYQNKLRWHSKGASVDVTDFNATGENEIFCAPTLISVNSNAYVLSGSGTNSTSPITLFYAKDYPYGNKGIYRLHSCKIYDDNGTLIRDYIPVLDQSGTPCLYDNVNNNFLYNQGTGNFLYA